VSNSLNRLSLDLSKYQGELEEKTRRLEQANQRYRQLTERLEQQVEEKTRELREFFSLVTHDLRIPLAATQGYADLLLKRPGEMTEKQRRFSRSIRVANSHALELVRNLLDAMRYEAGQNQTIVPESFRFEELVEEVVSHLSVPGDEEKAAPLGVEVPPGVVVRADRTRIGRVLGNLMSNALRHVGSARLVAHVEGPNLRIVVQDDGPGIPAEHLPLLFEKFTHFPTETGPSSGLGLGLYIVRRILEGHGESIHVESQVGEGTRFWFHLPVEVSDDKSSAG
ncbi:MAG: HAMP domain-containing sensor histidine kinase, partial [Candidatus Eremiobacterota bacterium]